MLPEAHSALGNSVFDSVSGSPSSEGSALGSSYCGTSAFVNPFRVFVGPFRPEKPETDWDDKPGLPRVVIPVRFGVIWPFSARKPQNGLG